MITQLNHTLNIAATNYGNPCGRSSGMGGRWLHSYLTYLL